MVHVKRANYSKGSQRFYAGLFLLCVLDKLLRPLRDKTICMKIITYNVNGIRAAIAKGLLDWIRDEGPDVLLLQETKAQPEQVPVLDFEMMGYQTYWHSAQKKGYSGVAILTSINPDRVIAGMGIKKYDDEGRFLRVDYGDLSIVSVYHPSGSSGDHRQSFKMEWLDDFYGYVHDLIKERPNLIISGDYNICHRPIDIHDPVRNATVSGFLPEEREWMTKFLDSGFIDTFRYFDQNPHQYTWWSFRMNARERNLGWRIDYHMASFSVESRLKNAAILSDVIHSDHCPVMLEMD
jgi:exodeoxyribonuclease-3